MRVSPFRIGLVGLLATSAGCRWYRPRRSPTRRRRRRSTPGSVPSAEAATASDYWTPERMRAAIPADVLVTDAVASTPLNEVANGDPVTYGGGGVGPQSTESPVSNIGKVFFTMDGLNYVCSGNSAGAANGSVVSTAAHCVHGGGEGETFATRWIFVPAYENGAAPYGQWAAESLLVPNRWAKKGDLSFDTGFVKVETLNEQTLAQSVGASPIAFNQARGLSYEAFGYPAAPPFDGQTLESCAGTANPDPFFQYDSQGIPCDMTGGSSGGPWFLLSGAQNSVNSFGYNILPDVMFGPYYGVVAQTAYAAAAGS